VQNVLLTDGGKNSEEIRKNDELMRPEMDLTTATKAQSIDAKRADDVKRQHAVNG
jgi:hypothetical protein